MAAKIDRLYWTNFQQYANWRAEKTEEPSRAIALFATYDEYRKIAEVLSAPAKFALVWTLHGTPLDLTPSAGYTKEDFWFKHHECEGPKVRLVIFRTFWELGRYIRAQRLRGRKYDTLGEKLLWWLNARFYIRERHVHRCDMFEKYCRGDDKKGDGLYFTTTYLIKKNTDQNSEVLDIGAIRSGKDELTYCFQSTFLTSTFAAATRNTTEQVKFFPLLDSCRGVDNIKHYKPFINNIIQRDKEELEKWAFTNPYDLRKKTNRFVWWVDRTPWISLLAKLLKGCAKLAWRGIKAIREFSTGS